MSDADGHEYIDFMGEFTAGPYGHSDPQFAAAIRSALNDGLNFGKTLPLAELAGLIKARFSSMELMRFTNSGTEANLLALALLIFDEVMTSRLSPGGIQGRTGITPDLTTLGKNIGGGMSAGVFGGLGAIMGRFDPRRADALPHAGTFNNNALTMAAGAVGLRDIFTPDAAKALNTRGDRLRPSVLRLTEDTRWRLKAHCGPYLFARNQGA